MHRGRGYRADAGRCRRPLPLEQLAPEDRLAVRRLVVQRYETARGSVVETELLLHDKAQAFGELLVLLDGEVE